MKMMQVNGATLHVRLDGPADGLPVLFANSLGTDLRVWDALMPHLPKGLRLIRYDKRGHGLSDLPLSEWGMADLVADASALLDALALRNVVVVGLSIGGIIAQGLAAERPDLVRGMVLLATAAKIGTPHMWEDRISAIRSGGIDPLADQILERWFSTSFRADRAQELRGWRNMLTRTDVEGYVRCAKAIADSDLLESTARLTLPAMAVAGTEDGSTPPDLVRETAGLIPDCSFHVVPGAGHLPCVEEPEHLASLIRDFLDLRLG